VIGLKVLPSDRHNRAVKVGVIPADAARWVFTVARDTLIALAMTLYEIGGSSSWNASCWSNSAQMTTACLLGRVTDACLAR
jgi:hypothetical protein